MLGRTLAVVATVGALIALPAVATAATPQVGQWSGGLGGFSVELIEDTGHLYVVMHTRPGWNIPPVNADGHWAVCHTTRIQNAERHQCIHGHFPTPTTAVGHIDSWMTPPGHHAKFGMTHHEWTAHLES